MTELLCIRTSTEVKACVAGIIYEPHRQIMCSCGDVSVDIGFSLPTEYIGMTCGNCNSDLPNDRTLWISKELFFREIGTEDECEQYREKVLIEK